VASGFSRIDLVDRLLGWSSVFPGHPERLPSFEYLGQYRYSLTFCAFERERRFTDADAVELVLSQFLRAATETAFAILAYCFMPDHVHLLIEGRSDTSDAKQFISRARQYSGFYYSQRFKKRLWQRYGYEHVLRSDEAMLDVARYILANPVRAGLVQNPEDYPFSGSGVYELKQLLDGVADTRSA
jgi:REP-associated tyrosine transposase